MDHGPRDLLTRTKRFALQVVKLVGLLPGTSSAQIMGRQVLRSGTSVGAHVREGKHSRSTAERLSKASVALQELEETRYWLELLEESGIVRNETLDALKREADELAAMLFTGVQTLKRRIR